MVGLTDRLDMTVAVDWDVKPQNNNKTKHSVFSVIFPDKCPRGDVWCLAPNWVPMLEKKKIDKRTLTSVFPFRSVV